jgi:hypothetical protein
LDITAKVIHPDARGITSDIAGEFYASQLAPVMRRTNLGLIDWDNRRKSSDSQTGDEAASHHHGHTVRESLKHTTNKEDHGTVQNGFSPADDITYTSDTEGRYQSTDFENGDHGADLCRARLVEGISKEGATITPSVKQCGQFIFAYVIMPDITP